MSTNAPETTRRLETETAQRQGQRFVRLISWLVVDRRAKLQVKLAKPIAYLWFFFVALFAMICVLVGVINAQSNGWKDLLLSAFGIPAAGWAWYIWRNTIGPLRGTAQYKPGKSFRGLRYTDAGIRRLYRLFLWGGIAGLVLVVPYVLYGKSEFMRVVQLLLASLGAIGVGYYGRIAKELHADVDHVAVDTLRAAAAIKRERVLAAHTNFDPTVAHKKRDGHATLAVLADRLILLYFRDGAFHRAQLRFSEVTALGMLDKNLEVQFLVEMKDGATFWIIIDSTVGLTTEVKSFARTFLSAFDDALHGGAITAAPARRRNVTIPSESASTSAEQMADQKTSEHQPERALELDPGFAAMAAVAKPLPPSRSLELFV